MNNIHQQNSSRKKLFLQFEKYKKKIPFDLKHKTGFVLQIFTPFWLICYMNIKQSKTVLVTENVWNIVAVSIDKTFT